MIKYLPIAGLVAAALGVAAPAPAQDSALVVYGNDPCPANTICVRAPESERYRIPKSLRSSNLPPSQQPGKLAATSRTGGATGPATCSNIGGGGGSMCLKNQLAAAKAEREQKKTEDANSPVPK